MSTTGQWVGAIAGGVIGFFTLGGPMGAVKGAAYGAALGGYIDPPPGPNLRGPTLDDKSFQSSAYGVSLATLHGTIATMGNIIYLENNEYKAVTKKESQGGKGGGGGTYETTTYFATFAVAFCEAIEGYSPIRIWAGGKLIYSVATNDIGSVLQSSQVNFRFYDGAQLEPDSRMESVLGVGQCPAYTGTAYIIFYDFDLTDYGNGLAGCPIKVEFGLPGESGGGVSDGAAISLAFKDDVDNHKTILPLMQNGVATSVASSPDLPRYFYQQYSDIAMNKSGGKFLAEEGGRTYISLYSLSGVAYSQSVVYVSHYYEIENDLPVYKKSINIGGREIPNPFVGDNSTDLWHANFARVFESSANSFYCIMNTTPEGVPLYGEGSFIWMVESSKDIRLEFNGGVVGFGASHIALIDDGMVKVYDAYNFDFSHELEFPYPVDLNYLDNPAIISGQLLYILTAFDSLNNSFEYATFDIKNGNFKEYSFQVQPDSDPSKYEPCISVVGNVVAIGLSLNSGDIVKVFLSSSLSSDFVNATGVLLIDIVNFYMQRSGIGQEFYELDQLNGEVVRGYRVDGLVSARGALSDLQAAFAFDFAEVGYTLKAIKRGAEPDGTIPYEHFIPSSSGGLVSVDKTPDVDLPSRYSINFIDRDREYDANTSPLAMYPSSFLNERQEDVAVVLSADEAAKLVDVFINVAWVERYKYKLTLPQNYLYIKPGMTKQIEVQKGRFVDTRIEQVDYSSDQTVSVVARSTGALQYVSSAEGVPANPPSTGVGYRGLSYSVFMDIPLMAQEMDRPGFVLHMRGGQQWPGGILMSSSDQGQTFSPVANADSFSAIGVAINHQNINDCYVIDGVSELIIDVYSGEFSSVTEYQMMTGKNYAAYGVDGRWEIVQFSSVVENADETVTISGFIRGLRGTEWAASIHESGDYFIALDYALLDFVGLDVSAFGAARKYKSVTYGSEVSAATESDFKYNGVNLKPLSPQHVTGARDGSGNWIISWVGRTRYASSFWVTGVQPQNEPSVNYLVNIIKDGTVVRVISSAVESAQYLAGQQIEDFGAVQSEIDFSVYQISAAVGAGFVTEVSI